MQNLTVLGAGVLGSQIALQGAYHGKDVTLYDLNATVLDGLDQRWNYLRTLYLRDLADATDDKINAAISRIRTTNQLDDAVADAEIIIEAVPENLEIKRDTWSRVARLAPNDTIFTTNSSTLLPSDIAESTGRPDKFLALHFANEVWRNNTGEVMGHAGTDPEAVSAVAKFAEEIGLFSIVLHREQPGYILNSLLVPFLSAAAKLYVNDVAGIEDIDTTWRRATGSPLGPFQIYDIVGMHTPYQLNVNSDDPDRRKFAEIIKRDFIDKGHLGRATGKGFYSYE